MLNTLIICGSLPLIVWYGVHSPPPPHSIFIWTSIGPVLFGVTCSNKVRSIASRIPGGGGGALPTPSCTASSYVYVVLLFLSRILGGEGLVAFLFFLCFSSFSHSLGLYSTSRVHSGPFPLSLHSCLLRPVQVSLFFPPVLLAHCEYTDL